MKFKMKQLLLSSLFTFLITAASAQNNAEVGIKGGLNLSNIINDEITDQNMRVGYHAGLFFKAPLTSFLAIQPEVLYTTKGTTAEYSNFLTGTGEFTQELNYLETPVLAVLNLSDAINIHAGPYFAYLLNAQVENKSANSDFNFTEGLNEDDFERLDYGLSAGVGFESDVIRIGARYNYGMREIGKEQDFSLNGSNLTSNSFKSSRNSAFSIYFGLSF